MTEEYGGLRGAYRFAYGASSSLLFRSYLVVSVLVGVFVSLLLVLGTVSWLAHPTGLVGEHALLWVLGLLVLVPLAAPVLLVARRHRLGDAPTNDERALALAGYLFLLSWYVALIVTDPRDHDVSGTLGPAIDFLDSLPRLWGLASPVLGAAVIGAIAWLTRE